MKKSKNTKNKVKQSESEIQKEKIRRTVNGDTG
jgi:hypothetical protein